MKTTNKGNKKPKGKVGKVNGQIIIKMKKKVMKIKKRYKIEYSN